MGRWGGGPCAWPVPMAQRYLIKPLPRNPSHTIPPFKSTPPSLIAQTRSSSSVPCSSRQQHRPCCLLPAPEHGLQGSAPPLRAAVVSPLRRSNPVVQLQRDASIAASLHRCPAHHQGYGRSRSDARTGKTKPRLCLLCRAGSG